MVRSSDLICEIFVATLQLHVSSQMEQNNLVVIFAEHSSGTPTTTPNLDLEIEFETL